MYLDLVNSVIDTALTIIIENNSEYTEEGLIIQQNGAPPGRWMDEKVQSNEFLAQLI